MPKNAIAQKAIAARKTMSDRFRTMFGASPATALAWANEVRVWATAIAAVVAVVAFLANWAANRLQTVVSAEKDEAFRRFQIASEERTSEARAATANADAAAAQARAAEAYESAARANARTAELQMAAEQARAEYERLREANLKLEERIAPRRVTAEQAVRLADLLRQGPRGPVTIVPKTFDEEATAFAEQIAGILQEAGFQLQPPSGPRPMSFGARGAFIWVQDPAAPPPHAALIQYCFGQVGIELPAQMNREVVSAPDVVYIGIAAKP